MPNPSDWPHATIRRLQRENAALKKQVRTLHARRAKGKPEFSKCILICAGSAFLALTIFSCALAWRALDTSVMVCLITAYGAELSTAIAFYMNKAKAENQIKLSASENIRDSNEIGG